jgi:hypothetical protein
MWPIFVSDCWYLYALNPLDRYLSGQVNTEPDQTIEILMTELDPKIMQIFTKAQSSSAAEATRVGYANVASLFRLQMSIFFTFGQNNGDFRKKCNVYFWQIYLKNFIPWIYI